MEELMVNVTKKDRLGKKRKQEAIDEIESRKHPRMAEKIGIITVSSEN